MQWTCNKYYLKKVKGCKKKLKTGHFSLNYTGNVLSVLDELSTILAIQRQLQPSQIPVHFNYQITLHESMIVQRQSLVITGGIALIDLGIFPNVLSNLKIWH